MDETLRRAVPASQSGGVLVTHLVCTECQGPVRPGAKALCGHVIAVGKVPADRRKQRCVVCSDLYRPHVMTHA
jgi:hypothetical protein